jgi:hypothetical protein
MIHPEMLEPLMKKLQPETFAAFLLYYGVLFSANTPRHFYVGPNYELISDKEGITKDKEKIEKEVRALLTGFEYNQIDHLVLEAKALCLVTCNWDIRISLYGLGECVLKSASDYLEKEGFVLNVETGKYNLPHNHDSIHQP